LRELRAGNRKTASQPEALSIGVSASGMARATSPAETTAISGAAAAAFDCGAHLG
jgi:hypothetical protein